MPKITAPIMCLCGCGEQFVFKPGTIELPIWFLVAVGLFVLVETASHALDIYKWFLQRRLDKMKQRKAKP